MANLTSWTLAKYHPDIGGNRAAPEADRLTLRIATGLPSARLSEVQQAFFAALKASAERTSDDNAADAAALASAFSGVVEFTGAHTIDGKPVETLEQYIAVVSTQAGLVNLLEIQRALSEYNSLEGSHRLFSERQSGGSPTTQAPTAARSASPTDGR